VLIKFPSILMGKLCKTLKVQCAHRTAEWQAAWHLQRLISGFSHAAADNRTLQGYHAA